MNMTNDTRKNKIVAITMVRNECDIIESFVRHTLSFADRLLVIDHESCDTTPVILNKLQQEGLSLTVKTFTGVGHEQIQVMTKLLFQAFNAYHADIVLPLDADEFLISTDSRIKLRDLLQELPQELYSVFEHDHRLETEENIYQGFPLSYPMKCLPLGAAPVKKVIIGRDAIKENFVGIAMGNHGIVTRDLKGHTGQNLPGVKIVHMPIRSREQMLSKYLSGWITSVAATGKFTDVAHHWHTIFQNFLDGKEIDIFNREIDENGKVVQLKPYVEPQTMRYLTYSHPNAMKNVLLTAERIAHRCAAEKHCKEDDIVSLIVPYTGNLGCFKQTMESIVEQDYPYKEVIILTYKDIEDLTPDLPRNVRGMIYRLHLGDMFQQVKINGKYIQWMYETRYTSPAALSDSVIMMKANLLQAILMSCQAPEKEKHGLIFLHEGEEIVGVPKVNMKILKKIFLESKMNLAGGISSVFGERQLWEKASYCFKEFQPTYFSEYCAVWNLFLKSLIPNLRVAVTKDEYIADLKEKPEWIDREYLEVLQDYHESADCNEELYQKCMGRLHSECQITLT